MFTTFALCFLYGPDLSACISGIEVIKVILDAGEVADAVSAVHAIVDGDEAHIILRERDLHQHTRLQIISAESRLVFDDDYSNLASLDIFHHFFECGTVKVCTTVAVVHVEFAVVEAMFVGILLQDQLLISYGVGFAL